MKLDRRLNLIIPITRDDGSTIYIHSTPITEETFDAYFIIIWKAFSAIYMNGSAAALIGAAKIAFNMLKKIATDEGLWDGDGGVKNGLLAEIYRLSSVVLPGPNGWTSIPLQVALAQDFIDESELTEARGILVFFILTSAMYRKAELPAILQASAAVWKCRVDSSSCMEFIASLQTSTQAASTGETVKASRIPA